MFRSVPSLVTTASASRSAMPSKSPRSIRSAYEKTRLATATSALGMGADAKRHTVAMTGEVLWTPPADVRATSRIGRFLAWLEAERGRTFEDHEALWQWSVEDLDGFW